jgi:hypothetical protein
MLYIVVVVRARPLYAPRTVSSVVNVKLFARYLPRALREPAGGFCIVLPARLSANCIREVKSRSLTQFPSSVLNF